MNIQVDFDKLQQGKATPTENALAFFDQLEPITVEEMLGTWHGSGFPTNHSMDGLLENFEWVGKEFQSAEDVHPLMFHNRKGKVFLDPRWMPLKYARNTPLASNPISRMVFKALMPILKTRKSRARLRMLEYRGKVSATMIYDEKPINDVFRKIDDNTVLGLMDLKQRNKKPFFFMLRRA